MYVIVVLSNYEYSLALRSLSDSGDVTVVNQLAERMTLTVIACILLRVLGQVQGFRLTQHWLLNKIFKPVLR
jgi:hypothetical protein